MKRLLTTTFAVCALFFLTSYTTSGPMHTMYKSMDSNTENLDIMFELDEDTFTITVIDEDADAIDKYNGTYTKHNGWYHLKFVDLEDDTVADDIFSTNDGRDAQVQVTDAYQVKFNSQLKGVYIKGVFCEKSH